MATGTYTFDNDSRLTGAVATPRAPPPWPATPGPTTPPAASRSSSRPPTARPTTPTTTTTSLPARPTTTRPTRRTRYDANGNRTNTGYTTGSDNRMTSDGTYNYTYDAEGNRTAKFVDNNANGVLDAGDTSITQYTWDYRNRLTDVTQRSTYGGADHQGHRLRLRLPESPGQRNGRPGRRRRPTARRPPTSPTTATRSR